MTHKASMTIGGREFTIETGKLADFVILDQDILTIEPVKIKDTKVLMTVLDGEIIYTAN